MVLNNKRRICHVFPRFTSRFIPEPGKQTGHSLSGALLSEVTVRGGHPQSEIAFRRVVY